MKKFIVLYRASKIAMETIKNSSPEDMKKGMGPWMAWAKKCGPNLVDMGTPLGNGQKVSGVGNSPSMSGVVGYSVLQAENMKKALEMLKEHPHIKMREGCDIEVHEAMPMPK